MPTRLTRSSRWPGHSIAVLVVLTLIAAALFAIVAPTNSAIYQLPVVPSIVLGVVQCASIPLAAIVPRISIGSSLVAAVAIALLAHPSGEAPWPWPVAGMVAYILVIIVLALRERWLISLSAWVLGSVVSVFVIAFGFSRFSTLEGAIATGIVMAGSSGLVLLVCLLAAQRRQLGAERRVSAEEQARRQVIEERTRVARELHDVVAHGLSLITVQATTAPYRLLEVNDETAAEFEQIAAAARGALGEMRQLLGVLRAEQGSAERAPQPTADQISGLVTRARATGVVVDVHLPDDLSALPDTVSLTVYRIVQEALSNVIRHAPGAAARVNVARGFGIITVSVVNDAPPGGVSAASAVNEGRSGLGLIGIRERVALLGGRSMAGPTKNGGFEVRAELAVPDSSVAFNGPRPAPTAEEEEGER